MIVTINTDASFNRSVKRGSFAFWIVCNDFKITRSGLLKEACERPEIAEFKCIINAFHVLYTQNITTVSKIIVNTDCLNVIHLLTANKEAIRKYRLNKWGNVLVNHFNRLKKKNGAEKILIEFRHVKSHVTTEGARNWVNDWCDSNAKYHLRRFVFEQQNANS